MAKLGLPSTDTTHHAASIFFSYLNIVYIALLLLTLWHDPLVDLSPDWGKLAEKAQVSQRSPQRSFVSKCVALAVVLSQYTPAAMRSTHIPRAPSKQGPNARQRNLRFLQLSRKTLQLTRGELTNTVPFGPVILERSSPDSGVERIGKS